MKQIRHYLVLIILLTAFMVNAQTITSVSLSPAGPYCPGAAVSVTFVINTTGGNFKPSNTFTAELSSSAGSFASPVVIGTLKTTAAGTINATLPAAPAAGTSYVIRVISSNPASTGASSSAFEIKATCGGGGGGSSLDNLTDVTITTPATGQLLKFDGSAWVNSTAAIGDITGLQTALDAKLAKNSAITGETKTKVTYDANGLVTAGADAGIADITGLQTALDAKLAKNSVITGATKTKVTYNANGLVTAGADAGIADIDGLQTALDAKLAKNSAITGETKTKVTYDANGLVTAGADAGIADIDGLQTALDAKLAKNSAITGETKTKVTYDANGLVTAGADAGIADITGLQTALDAKLANTAGLSNLSGVSISSPSNNQVLTYNGTNWVNANASGGGGSGWSLTGNSGLSSSTNFIGTTDQIPLVFKYNSTRSGHIALNNTSLGFNSLPVDAGNNNTAIGADACSSNTSGNQNVAIGSKTLYSNKTASFNTAIGNNALYNNTSGSSNIAIGYGASYNGNGNDNVAIGNNAMFGGPANTATSNVAIGISSLENITSGLNNVAIGINSLYGVSSSFNNTAVGAGALQSTEGARNTALGWRASVASGVAIYGATAIGESAVASASDKVRIGSSLVTVIEGAVGFSVASDGRFKKNVKEDAPGLNLIMKLRPVTYNFEYGKFSEHLKEKSADKTHLQQRESKKEMGFVAQEVEKALKDAGTEVDNLVNLPQNANDYYSLSYSELVVPLVKAVQEQQKIIEELKKAVEVLQKQSPATTIGGTAAQATVLEMPETSTLLGQNIPNPFNTKTIIPFRLPANCNSAAIVITNITTGKSIRAIPVSSSETQLSLDASKLPSGNYAYSLYIDGKVVDTKKMMMVR